MYMKFSAIIAVATVIVFGLMYLNFANRSCVLCETRVFMALVRGACMAVIMLVGMRNMYPYRGANVAIILTSAVVFAVSLWLIRSQATVYDVAYMKAMIPHHSIAT